MGAELYKHWLVVVALVAVTLTLRAVCLEGEDLRARDAGRASILECSRSDIRRCRIALYGVSAADIASIGPHDQVQFVIGGRLVYAATKLRLLKPIVGHGRLTGVEVVSSGRWLVGVRKPQFHAHGAHAAAFVIERAGAGIDWEDPGLFKPRRERPQPARTIAAESGANGDDLLFAGAAEEPASQPRAASAAAAPAPATVVQPAPAAPVQTPGAAAPAPITNINIVNRLGSEAAGSGLNADGTDDFQHPRLALRTQIGTPNSATGMFGLGLDIYVAKANIPISLGYGMYDSRLFMDPSRGSVTYRTTSIGSGYLVGHHAAQMRFGADFVHTAAKITAGGSNPKGEPIDAHAAGSSNYLGLAPSIGLNILTDDHAFFLISVGQYYMLSGNFKSDPGATYQSVSNSTNPTLIKNSSTVLNLGLGYNF